MINFRKIADLFDHGAILNLAKHRYKLLIYNALNFLQILLGFIFHLFLGRFFGASSETDTCFVSITIMTSCSTLGLFFTDMFMQYYNDIKINDNEEAKKFYQAVYNFSLLIGLGIYFIVMIFINPIIRVFVSGFNIERINALKSFFNIIAFNLIWIRLVSLNNTLLNAEMRFVFPYLIGLLTPLFNIIFLVLYAKTYGINIIAWSITLSTLVGLILQQIYIYKILKITPGKRFWHCRFGELIKKSFSMRIGHQIWGLKDPITTNVLSHFPAGTVSLYFYALRIISILFTITNSPILQFFSSKVSRLVSERDFSGIKKLLKKFLIANTALFFVVLLPFTIVLTEILRFIFGNKFSSEDIETIYYLFLTLIPFHIILSVELPFVNITIAMKQSLRVIRIGIVFLILYGVSLFLLKEFLNVYSIPVALIIAQTQNLIVYTLNVRRSLKENLWTVQPAVIRQKVDLNL